MANRQWPEVSNFVICFCTLHKSNNTRTSKNCTLLRAFLTCLCVFCLACNSSMSVCFLTHTMCKNVRQNLIPWATAWWPSLYQHFLLWGYTEVLITPILQAAKSGPGTVTPLQALQNSGGHVFMLRVKPQSAGDSHWWNSRKKKL